MEKVLLWGTGFYYETRYNLIRGGLIDSGKIEILALVSRDEHEKIKDGYKVITKENVKEYDYDRIIILTGRPEVAESIMKDIEELHIPKERVMDLPEYLKYAEVDDYTPLIQQQMEVLKDILNASDEEISDHEWMCGKISQYGIYPFGANARSREINWTEYGLNQVLEEFAGYCNYIGSLERIETAIEIGVYRGRSSYIMCALLLRKNPNLRYIMVDIYDQLDSFQEFQKVLPALEKKIPSTSDDYKGESYDFVFIDADHSYDAAMRDYLNVGQYAGKLTVFHDIYAHEYDECNGGTVRMWKEVCELNSGKEKKIFSIYPDQWMGIGCLVQK